MASIDVPAVLPDQASLRRALEYAVRAPSVYNSQPWRWRADTTDGVDLFADPDRHLITIDTDGRDLLLSCGAALHHLVVALAGMGWSSQVERFPDRENTHHLAHLQPVVAAPPADTARLAAAIPRRHTDRRRFSAEPVDRALLETLIGRAAGCGTELHVVAGDAARMRLIEMVTRSASLQRQQAGYAAELARWTGRYAAAGDGITAGNVAAGIGHPGEIPMRAFTRGALAQSPHSFEHPDASVLMVLSSPHDDRLGALRAGEATSAVLLTATDMGLATTPLSQPLEVVQTRASITEHIIGPQSFPQLLLRVGWPQPGCPELPPAPRRALDHVLAQHR
ncbi:Acg family FMN-binding oxidoreductase [Pseudonocardia saturnea]